MELDKYARKRPRRRSSATSGITAGSREVLRGRNCALEKKERRMFALPRRVRNFWEFFDRLSRVFSLLKLGKGERGVVN